MAEDILYADTPETVAKVVGALERAADRRSPVGFDTEFYGVDIGAESCYPGARIHLLSVAVKRYPRVLSPRGFDVSDAAVLPASQLPALKAWLESDSPKIVHNLPVDAHALANHGVKLNGGINSLALSRWAWPGRARGAGFTLDSLGMDLVGVGKPESFRELFQEEYVEYRSTFRKVRRCQCGVEGCRRRQTVEGHSRYEDVVETVHEKLKMREVPLQAVVPGHPLWMRALKYSAQDAVLALAVYDLAMREMSRVERDVPWLLESTSESSRVPSGSAHGETIRTYGRPFSGQAAHAS